jgi:hypothetical protein
MHDEGVCIPTFDVPADAPPITPEMAERALDE